MALEVEFVTNTLDLTGSTLTLRQSVPISDVTRIVVRVVGILDLFPIGDELREDARGDWQVVAGHLKVVCFQRRKSART